MYLHLGTLGQGTLKEDSVFFVCVGGGETIKLDLLNAHILYYVAWKNYIVWDSAPWLSLCVQNFLHSKNRANTVLNSWNGSNKFGNLVDLVVFPVMHVNIYHGATPMFTEWLIDAGWLLFCPRMAPSHAFSLDLGSTFEVYWCFKESSKIRWRPTCSKLM